MVWLASATVDLRDALTRIQAHFIRGRPLDSLPRKMVVNLLNAAKPVNDEVVRRQDTFQAYAEVEAAAPALLAALVAVQGGILRELARLGPEGSLGSELQPMLIFLVTSTWWGKVAQPDAVGRCVGRAVLRGDTLACYARVIDAWATAKQTRLQSPLLMVLTAMVSVVVFCARASRYSPTGGGSSGGSGSSGGVRGGGGSNGGVTGSHGDSSPSGGSVAGQGVDTELYRELVAALQRSQVLEHAARALLQLQARSAMCPSPASRRTYQDDLTEGWSGLLEIIELLMDMQLLSGRWEGMCLRQPYDGIPSAIPAAAAQLPALRTLLAGPCLQYLLGQQLAAARLGMTGGAGPRHGLTAAQLVGVDVPPPPSRRRQQQGRGPEAGHASQLLRVVHVATIVWHTIVSGPCAPQMAQGTRRWLACTNLDAAPPPPLPPPPPLRLLGMPYRAVNVYDMVAESLACIVGNPAVLQQPDIRPNLTVALLTDLAARLLTELRPCHAQQRLPAQWCMLCKVLAGVDLCMRGMNGFTMLSLLHLLSRHLRLLLPAPQPVQLGVLDLTVLSPQAAPGCAAATRAGRSDGNVGVASVSESSCTYSLRCALDGGFLPALEVQLRRAARNEPPKGARLQLSLVNTLLRGTGIWPALLAHGSARQVTSLICALRQLPLALRQAPPVRVLDVQAQGVWRCSKGEDAEDAALHYLVALLEQTAAAVLPPPPPPAQPPTPNAAGGSSSSSSSRSNCGSGDAGSGDAGSASSGSSNIVTSAGQPAASNIAPPRSLLDCNDSLEPDAPPMDPDWLGRASGMPALGSAAGAQQRALAALAAYQWLPVLRRRLRSIFWSQGMALAVARWLLAVGLQALAARTDAVDATVGDKTGDTGTLASAHLPILELAIAGASDGPDASAALAPATQSLAADETGCSHSGTPWPASPQPGSSRPVFDPAAGHAAPWRCTAAADASATPSSCVSGWGGSSGGVNGGGGEVGGGVSGGGGGEGGGGATSYVRGAVAAGGGGHGTQPAVSVLAAGCPASLNLPFVFGATPAQSRAPQQASCAHRAAPVTPNAAAGAAGALCAPAASAAAPALPVAAHLPPASCTAEWPISSRSSSSWQPTVGSAVRPLIPPSRPVTASGNPDEPGAVQGLRGREPATAAAIGGLRQQLRRARLTARYNDFLRLLLYSLDTGKWLHQLLVWTDAWDDGPQEGAHGSSGDAVGSTGGGAVGGGDGSGGDVGSVGAAAPAGGVTYGGGQALRATVLDALEVVALLLPRYVAASLPPVRVSTEGYWPQAEQSSHGSGDPAGGAAGAASPSCGPASDASRGCSVGREMRLWECLFNNGRHALLRVVQEWCEGDPPAQQTRGDRGVGEAEPAPRHHGASPKAAALAALEAEVLRKHGPLAHHNYLPSPSMTVRVAASVGVCACALPSCDNIAGGSGDAAAAGPGDRGAWWCCPHCQAPYCSAACMEAHAAGEHTAVECEHVADLHSMWEQVEQMRDVGVPAARREVWKALGATAGCEAAWRKIDAQFGELLWEMRQV